VLGGLEFESASNQSINQSIAPYNQSKRLID